MDLEHLPTLTCYVVAVVKNAAANSGRSLAHLDVASLVEDLRM